MLGEDVGMKLIVCRSCKKRRMNAGAGRCQACYSWDRYHGDPEYRKRHNATMRTYIARNKVRIYAYNKRYKKRIAKLKK